MTSLADLVYDALAPIPTIGGPGNPRVYRGSLPQPYTLPALTFYRVDTVFEYAHNGNNLLIHPRFQISCWAATNAAAEALALAVQTKFDAWTLGKALPQGQTDLSDPETGVHQVAIDYILWWNVT